MLIRIVRMTFAPDTIDDFLNRFDDSAPQIRQFPGCQHLTLWRDVDTPHVCTTHSHWDDADALNQYRDSDLFKSTWADVKPFFADRPEAHSYTVARSANAIESSRP
ncbi:MAG: antibiotic biosynthesis monooxygenase [Bacteroidetes bacterium SW_9_63_38]|nr:MAG: antibiotic biosynthesis monooxygenase [Bacteroidetes bacterium SW_9_63_38]